MSLQQFYQDHFDTSGNVVKIRPALLAAQTFSKTFPLAVTSHDFQSDANWTAAAYPDATDVDITAQLGDGVDQPNFYAMNRGEFGSLTMGSHGLKIFAIGDDTGLAWPSGNASPQIMVRLPVCQTVSVEFTVRMSGFSNVERVSMGVLQRIRGAQPAAIAQIDWVALSSSTATENTTLWGNLYAATTSLNTFITSNICTRHYKLDILGPNVAAYGAAVGSSSATTRLAGRSSALINEMTDLVFYLGAGTAGTPAGTYLAELSALSITGTRSII